MLKFKIILLLFIAVFSTNWVVSQNFHQTQKGEMIIKAVVNDSIFEIKTKELLILLDYQDASFTMKMDKSTFRTGIDSIDNKLKLLKYDIITFKGQLGIKYININDDTPPNFLVEGVLSTNSKIIKGTGNLLHTSSKGRYSGILTLDFTVNKNDLGLDFGNLNLEDEINIEVTNVVLNPITEQ